MRENTVFTKKEILIFGYASFLVLFALALFFYKERIGTLDSAFHLFQLLRTETPAIQNLRFVAVLTQLLPLVGAKFGLSLSDITILYSASHVLVQCCIFSVIILVIKNTRMALAYLLFLLLITTHTFFWVQSELTQGVGFLFIYFALVEKILIKQKAKLGLIFGLVVLLITIAFSHPLLVFPFLFFHVFHYGQNKISNKILTGAVFTYLFIALSRTLIFRAHYEQTAFGGLANFGRLFPDYFTLQSNSNFLNYLIHDFYFLITLLVLTMFYFSKEKKWFQLTIMSAFFFGYLLIVNVCYEQGARQFYLENQYLLLTLFLVIPFVSEVVTYYQNRSTNWRILKRLAPILILTLFAIRILHTSALYTDMLDWKRAIISNSELYKEKRVVIYEDQIPTKLLLDSWAGPYEFWFLSTLEKGYSQAAIIRKDSLHFTWTWDKYNFFISGLENHTYESLNATYFKFPEHTVEMVYIQN